MCTNTPDAMIPHKMPPYSSFAILVLHARYYASSLPMLLTPTPAAASQHTPLLPPTTPLPQDGCESLTHVPRSVEDVEAVMAGGAWPRG